jgi:glycosyltransferase involved in cell wall biosynthesis
MRILYWTRTGNKLGSLERYYILLAQECQRRGHGLVLMHDVPNTVPEYHESLRKAGARYMESGNSWKAPARPLLTAARLVREWHPSIIHTHFVNPLMLPALRVLSRGRIYTTFHSGIEGEIKLRTRLAGRFRQACSHKLLAVSERVRQDYIRAGISPSRMSTLYLGLDIESILAASDRSSAPVPGGYGNPRLRKVISVAQFQPVKGMVTVVEAAAIVLKRLPDIVWWLVGAEGPDTPKAQAVVRAAGLNDRILFLGQRNDVPALMKQACLQVVGSRSEGLPLMIVEAAALGVPTVGPNIGGVDEAILNGATGVLVDTPSPDGLAEAALRLLGDEALRERMGRRAAQFVREAFDARIHIARLLDMYENDVATCCVKHPTRCS